MAMSEYVKRLRDKFGNDLLQMPSVSIVTYDEKGRLLLVLDADTNLWTVPGGSIDPCEVPADAAVREMWEETGLLIDPIKIIGVYGGPDQIVEYSNGDRTSYVTIVFEGRIIKGNLRPDGQETIELKYFFRDEIKSLKLQPWLIDVVDNFFLEQKEPFFNKTEWKPNDY